MQCEGKNICLPQGDIQSAANECWIHQRPCRLDAPSACQDWAANLFVQQMDVFNCASRRKCSISTLFLQVNIVFKQHGKRLEHQGIRIEFVGQIGEF